jgi:hypothetical protein
MSNGHIDIHLRVPFKSDVYQEDDKATMSDAILEDIVPLIDGSDERDIDGFRLVLFNSEAEWQTTLGAPEIVWGDLDVKWDDDVPERAVPYGWKGRGQLPAQALAYLLGYCDYYAVGPGEAGVEIAKDNTFHVAYKAGWDQAGEYDYNGVETEEEA